MENLKPTQKLGLDNCKRCPDCNLVPEFVPTLDYDKKEAIEAVCEKHGHRALGKDLIQAVEHWNIYIEFTVNARKVA